MIDLYDIGASYIWQIPENYYDLNGTETRVTGPAKLFVNAFGQPVQVQPTSTPDPRSNGKFLNAPPGMLVQKFVSLERQAKERIEAPV